LSDTGEGTEMYRKAGAFVRQWRIGLIEYVKRKTKERKAKSKEEQPTDKAARRTTLATIWIAVFTSVLAGVGYFQWSEMKASGNQTDQLICLYRDQLAQLFRQASDTHELAEQAKKSSGIAERTLGVFEAQQRAWVVIAAPPVMQAAKSGVVWALRNFGGSPAFHVAAKGVIVDQAGEIFAAQETVCREIKAGPTWEFLVPGQDGRPRAAFAVGTPIAYVVGCVEYRDQFSSGRWTKFCFERNARDPNGFISCSGYNSTDGDAGKENERPGLSKNYSDDNATEASHLVDNKTTTPHKQSAKAESPHWYASPEWWLCILGLATLVFIGWQAKATASAAKVSERTLVLAERPRISVRVFYFTQDEGIGISYFGRHYATEPLFCSGQFYIQNSGGTDAKITEVYCETYVAVRLPMKRPYEGEKGLRHEKTLRPGESWPYSFGPPIKSPNPAELNTKRRLEEARLNFYVLGNVHYTDGLGIYRITSFCRRYDAGEDRFVPESNPDYENEP
jgi:hypothetical protein